MTEFATERSQTVYTLVGILLAMFLGALDQTIVATALPRIVADLHGLDRYAWVATAYLLASTVLVPIYGKLSDTHNRKTVELWAVGIFLTGSFLCGAAGEFGNLPLLGDGMTQLIVFRSLQGIGGAGLFAMAFIIIADLFPPAERAKYQGIVGSVFGVSSVIGPLVGGFLTDYATGWIPGVAGWRWVFYVNLPFGIIALWFIISKMPHLPPRGERVGLNKVSALLLLLTLVPLILALQLDKGTYPWDSAVTLGLFATFAVMLVLFILHSRADRNPILDLSLFRNRVFATSNIAVFFFGAGFLSTVIFLPLFMVNVLGVSATRAGVSIIPLSLGVMVGSFTAGQLVARFGHYRRFMVAGGIVFLAGAILLSTMTVDIAYWQVTLYMVICGIGIGPTMPLFPLAIQNSVPFQKLGQATSASQFFRQIGGTVGTAVMGTVLTVTLATAFAGQAQTMQRAMGGQAAGLPGADGGGRLNSAGPEKIRAEISARFQQEFDLIASAFDRNDHAALQQIASNPMLPKEFSAELAAGTPAEQVKKRFDGAYAALEGAVRSGDAARITNVFSRIPGAEAIPAGVEQRLIDAGRSGSAAAIRGALAPIRQRIDEQETQAARAATDQALSAIKKSLSAAADRIAGSVLDGVKHGFATAITRIYRYLIFIVVIGIIATLFVPELPLRKTHHPEGAASGAGQGTRAEGDPPEST